MQLENIHLLVFEITSHCNVKCPQCCRIGDDGELAPFVELKHWDVKQLLPNLEIEKLTNLKYVHIEGDQGDALMHPEIVDILDAFYNAPTNPTICILTNGALRSEDWWYNLGQRYNPERVRVQFSIDGLEDTHSLYRVGADYNKLIANARSFIRAGGNAAQRTLIFKHNEHQLKDIAEFSKQIGFKQFYATHSDIFRFHGLDKYPVTVNGDVTHYIEYTTLKTVNEYDYNNSSEIWDPSYDPRIEINTDETCINFRYGQLHITYKGHVIPCCIYNADLYFDIESNQVFRNLVGDVDLIDLHKNTLSTVIQHTYFNRLNAMLDSKKDPGRCGFWCGNKLTLDASSVIPIVPVT